MSLSERNKQTFFVVDCSQRTVHKVKLQISDFISLEFDNKFKGINFK